MKLTAAIIAQRMRDHVREGGYLVANWPVSILGNDQATRAALYTAEDMCDQDGTWIKSEDNFRNMSASYDEEEEDRNAYESRESTP